MICVFRVLFLVNFLFFPLSIFSQILFKEHPNYFVDENTLKFFEQSSTRKTFLLNGKWKVYKSKDDEQNKVTVTIPSVFSGETELIFEKSFTLSAEDVKNYNFQIYFWGINYSAEISLNNSIIYRHNGGEFPFNFILPQDLIYDSKPNTISVKLLSTSDAQNTIPVKQKFLFPENFGGIFRDVFIKLIPRIHLFNPEISYNIVDNNQKVKLKIKAKVENNEFSSAADTFKHSNNFEIKINVKSKSSFSIASTSSFQFSISKGREKYFEHSIELSQINFWSPAEPNSYLIDIQVLRDGFLLDDVTQQISFYSLKSEKDFLTLNGDKFQLKGTAYVPSFLNYGNLISYEQMLNDLKIIKECGFNSVRFNKSVPHPYYLYLCENLGLLALIEIPLNAIPESILENQIFVARSKTYLNNFLDAYKNYSSIAAIGIGSSFLGNSVSSNYFISEMTQQLKNRTNKLIYASFSGLNFSQIPKIDLYGIELLNKSISQVNDDYKTLIEKIGNGKIFISEIGYIANKGTSSGYTNAKTFEAQAKFFSDLLDYEEENYNAGFFINSMFDYRCNYSSIISGWQPNSIVPIGILGEERNTNRLAYKVIYSKLHNTEKVTIPLGVKKDDSPIIFILFGLGLALLMGFLVNSGRKFREDAVRALLRPYNFFSDLRDLRIISGVQTTFLGIIVSAVLSLLVSSLFYNFRYDPLFEKLLLSFGVNSLINIISYFTWHPIQALIWLTILFFIVLLFTSIIIKIFSFFVANKVFFTNTFYTVIWSFIPVVLTIPLAIVLYRLLNANVVNIYIYLTLIFFCGWIYNRLQKGIYVIFDVHPSKVYFYSVVFTILFFSAIIFIYQMKNLTFDYMLFSLKEFGIL